MNHYSEPWTEYAACRSVTEENTIITRDGRQCRTCKNAMRKPLTPEQKRRALDLRKQNRRQQREETANTSLTTAARTI